MPYITNYAVGFLKGAAANMATGAGAELIQAQVTAAAQGVQGAVMPTWQQIGASFAEGANATLGQKTMGWVLQAPGKAASSITGAINNGWKWVTDQGKKVFGVGSESAVADALSVGGNKATSFGNMMEAGAATPAQQYINDFYSAPDFNPTAYLGYDPKAVLAPFSQVTELPGITTSAQEAINDYYTAPDFDATAYLGYDPTAPSLLSPRLDKSGQPFEREAQRRYDRAVTTAEETRRAQPPITQPTITQPPITQPTITPPPAFEVLSDANRATAIESLKAGREAALAAGDMQQVAKIDAELARYSKIPPPTLGEKIVQGAISGARQTGIDWIKGMGQDIPGSILGGGGYLVDLLAYNNPSIYDEFDLTQQNSGNYFGGAAYSANTQGILPEYTYA
jgi:hypothetical protein